MHKPAAILAALFVAAPAFAQSLSIGLTTAPTALDPHYHAHAQNSATAAHYVNVGGILEGLAA